MISRLATRYLNHVQTVTASSVQGADTTESAMNGMPRPKALKLVQTVLRSVPTGGIHHDRHWTPIQAIWKAFEKAGVVFQIEKSEYRKDRDGSAAGKDTSKVWTVSVPFMNDKGRPTAVYVNITAAGCGGVADPLEAYDVVAYAT